MQEYENVKLKPKDVRQFENFVSLSDEEITPILAFLYELAKIETKITTNLNLTK